jgi:mRNA-degrading endonuclease RelE of RelBE toxin-antitoxin system
MTWLVGFSKKAAKKMKKLPENIQPRVARLVEEIRFSGSVRGNWKNYSKLGQNTHHCHIKSGQPTYVACWEVMDKKIKIAEVYDVATHEEVQY